MTRIEHIETHEVQRPDGSKYREIHEKVIREVLDWASSPRFNERAAERMKKHKRWWQFANMMGRNRKERRAWFRKIRREYGGQQQ